MERLEFVTERDRPEVARFRRRWREHQHPIDGAHLPLLPPCSPDLNPREMMVAKLKTLFRKADRRTIEEAWREVRSLLDRFSSSEGAACRIGPGDEALGSDAARGRLLTASSPNARDAPG